MKSITAITRVGVLVVFCLATILSAILPIAATSNYTVQFDFKYPDTYADFIVSNSGMVAAGDSTALGYKGWISSTNKSGSSVFKFEADAGKVFDSFVFSYNGFSVAVQESDIYDFYVSCDASSWTLVSALRNNPSLAGGGVYPADPSNRDPALIRTLDLSSYAEDSRVVYIRIDAYRSTNIIIDGYSYPTVFGGNYSVNATMIDAVIAPSVSFADIPTYSGGGAQSNYDCGDGEYMRYVHSTTLAEYDAYLSSLVSKGFVPKYTNSINNNLFREYVKGNVSIYVYYVPAESSVRIVVKPYMETEQPPESASDIKVDATLTQVGINYVARPNGMSYIMRTEEGSFIVIDGGWAGGGEGAKILNILKEQNPHAGKPRVAAWILTHPHSDHIGAISEFSTNEIILERIVYNFVNDDILGASDTSAMITNTNSYYQKIKRALDGAWKYTDVIKPHTGQIFNFDGVRIEVLHTHEDVYPEVSRLDYMNATSMAFSMEVAGNKIMILGDAKVEECTTMSVRYKGTLKSDYLQPTHHGSTGGYTPFYTYINPTVCLWAASYAQFDEYKDRDYNQYLLNNTNIADHCLSADGTKTYLLTPYAAKMNFSYTDTYSDYLVYNNRMLSGGDLSLMGYRGWIPQNGYNGTSVFKFEAAAGETFDSFIFTYKAHTIATSANDKYDFYVSDTAENWSASPFSYTEDNWDPVALYRNDPSLAGTGVYAADPANSDPGLIRTLDLSSYAMGKSVVYIRVDGYRSANIGGLPTVYGGDYWVNATYLGDVVDIEYPSGVGYNKSAIILVDGAENKNARLGRDHLSIPKQQGTGTSTIQLLIPYIADGGHTEYENHTFFVKREGGNTVITEQPALKNLSEYKGVAIRTNAALGQGLRFQSTLSLDIRKNGYSDYAVVEYGTLAKRSDNPNALIYINAESDPVKRIGKGIAYNGTDEYIFGQTTDRLSFTSVLVGIKSENYRTNYTFRSYCVLSNGTDTFIVYGKEITKNIYDVAVQVLSDPDNGLSGDQLLYLQSIINS